MYLLSKRLRIKRSLRFYQQFREKAQWVGARGPSLAVHCRKAGTDRPLRRQTGAMSVWQRQKNWWSEVMWKPKKAHSLEQLK